MPSKRLFVGLPLPPSLGERLLPLMPQAGSGLRATAPEDFHITLHFLGPAADVSVADALRVVSTEAPTIRIGAPGCFRHRRGQSVLYLGIDATPALEALHAAIGTALAVTTCLPEVRAFRPHLTLARLDRSADSAAVETFLSRPAPSIRAFVSKAFALFESVPGNALPRYRILREFPLPAPAGRG